MRGSDWEMVLAARALAIRAHGDQRRKYLGTPYWVHLAEVARWVAASVHGRDPELVAAAWLHDTLEDTALSPAVIERTCSARTLAIVELLTEPVPAPGLNRAARKAMVQARLAVAEPGVQTVKVADLLSNAPSILAHDPRFAPVFVSEARALVGVLGHADRNLRARLLDRLDQGAEMSSRGLSVDPRVWHSGVVQGPGR